MIQPQTRLKVADNSGASREIARVKQMQGPRCQGQNRQNTRSGKQQAHFDLLVHKPVHSGVVVGNRREAGIEVGAHGFQNHANVVAGQRPSGRVEANGAEPELLDNQNTGQITAGAEEQILQEKNRTIGH